MKNNCLILGCGYVGTFYLDKYRDSDWTSRKPLESKPSKQLEDIKADLNEPVYFDLVDKSTWNNLPDSRDVLWSFAINSPEEEQLALEFYQSHMKDRNVIVYSSTSAYRFETENEVVSEDHPIKLDKPRFSAEEKLREKGALVLHLSGIIGKDRYPLKWYENKWVKNALNILNYVHVDDIVYFTNRLFKNFKPGARFNLTSADYKTHQNIVEHLQFECDFVNKEKTSDSKKIENSKLLKYLDLVDYKFIKYPEDCT